MKSILIPQNIFVGDTAQFFVPLPEQTLTEYARRGLQPDIPIPLHTITQNEQMSIQDVRIIKQETASYLRITFIPWETGEITFPALPAVSSLVTVPSVHVSSLIANTASMTLQPPKPPLLLPGTDYLLYGAAVTGIGSLLLAGTVIWALLRRFGKRPRRTARKRLSILKKQLKQLHKAARHIQKEIRKQNSTETAAPYPAQVTETVLPETNNTAERAAAATNTETALLQTQANTVWDWYSAVDRTLREYLQSLMQEDGQKSGRYTDSYFTSATYTELTAALTELFSSQQNIPDLFAMHYTMLEQQRFASSAAQAVRDYAAAGQDMLKKIPYIAEKTEAAYTALKESRKAAESVAAAGPGYTTQTTDKTIQSRAL